MRLKQHLGVSIMALLGMSSPIQAETRYALLVLTYSCKAATLSRVQVVVDLLPKEAVTVVTSERLCVEESRIFEFGQAALVPSGVEIIKPPASVDMSKAGYVVVIRQVMELDVRASDV